MILRDFGVEGFKVQHIQANRVDTEHYSADGKRRTTTIALFNSDLYKTNVRGSGKHGFSYLSNKGDVGRNYVFENHTKRFRGNDP